MDKQHELYEALSKAQSEMTVAAKNNKNPHFRSEYADLASVIDAVREHLVENGIALTQIVDFSEDKQFLITKLMHKNGGVIESKMLLTPKDLNPQTMGSMLTYYRRYAISAICMIAPGAEPDDDGEKAQRKKAEVPVETLSEDEVKTINILCEGYADILNDGLAKAGVKHLGKFPRSRYQGFLDYLAKKIEERVREEEEQVDE